MLATLAVPAAAVSGSLVVTLPGSSTIDTFVWSSVNVSNVPASADRVALYYGSQGVGGCQIPPNQPTTACYFELTAVNSSDQLTAVAEQPDGLAVTGSDGNPVQASVTINPVQVNTFQPLVLTPAQVTVVLPAPTQQQLFTAYATVGGAPAVITSAQGIWTELVQGAQLAPLVTTSGNDVWALEGAHPGIALVQCRATLNQQTYDGLAFVDVVDGVRQVSVQGAAANRFAKAVASADAAITGGLAQILFWRTK